MPIDWVRYVFQIVVPKPLAPKELVQVYESQEMIVLPPWDPMVCILSLSLLEQSFELPFRVHWRDSPVMWERSKTRLLCN